MRVIKPDYYDKFVCAADSCPFTCCRDWKIAVDRDTLQKWKNTKTPASVNDSRTYLDEFVAMMWNGEGIKLQKDGFCPLLNERGLCNVVLEYGEEMISRTCHTFPREAHEFRDRVEKSLTVGCPVVLDLLWEKDLFSVSVSEEKYDLTEPVENITQPLYFAIRDAFLEFAQKSTLPPETVLKMIFYMALDFYQKGDALEKAYVQDAFQEEFLGQLARAVTEAEADFYEHIAEQNELFLDLAENYRKQNIYASVLEPLAERAEYYEAEECIQEFGDARTAFEETWEQLEGKMQSLMQEELYSTLLLPTGNLYTMTMKIQWLGIVFAVLKQMLFLAWDGHRQLDEETLKCIVIVLIRMTGYSEDDIEEYLENSFEDIIWDWGYMALILG